MALLATNGSAHKFVTHFFRSHVHQLAVSQVEQQEIVVKLAAVPWTQAFCRLELERATAGDQRIQVVLRRECVMRHHDREFEFDFCHATG
jgi:hypothetical protein